MTIGLVKPASHGTPTESKVLPLPLSPHRVNPSPLYGEGDKGGEVFKKSG